MRSKEFSKYYHHYEQWLKKGVAGDLFIHLLSGTHFITNSLGPVRIYSSGALSYWKDGRDVPDIPPPSNHLSAPGKTPESIVKILEEALEKVSRDPDFINDMKKLYANVCFLDSKATKIKHEEKALQLKPILQRAGLIK